jgi:2-oxoglutarate dehydrogenase E1 component
VPAGDVAEATGDYMKVMQLVNAYQTRGHSVATLDPLGMYAADLDDSTPPDLELSNYGFTEADLEKEFHLGNLMQSGFLDFARGPVKLRDILHRLQQVYASNIGVEYMHIWNHEQVNWIREQIETPEQIEFTEEEKLRMLDRLCWSDHFEAFLANKYPTSKRFGLEGCEVLIVGMKEMIDTAVDEGVEAIVLGMPHRGRLNVLGNVVRKPLEQIFAEFQGVANPNPDEDFSGSGDVKYHLGMSYTRPTPSGKQVNISLVANPSHLEAVNPVVEGKTRAKQHYMGDTERTKVMPILLHGDAAFSGQGVVFETMGLSDLHDYTTGGTIHVVVNNQIGFTTDPASSRSSPYCTDVAKAVQAPIFHVNGDDVEAVARVCRLAAKYRQKFKKDVVVDIVCYRKHGHNEIDNPMFTQPLMYTAIRKHPSTWTKYRQFLIESGGVREVDAVELEERVMAELNTKLEESRNYVSKPSDWLANNWAGLLPPSKDAAILDTGVTQEMLTKVGVPLTTLPETFSPHKKVGDVYKQRAKMIETGQGIDWALGEQLAWATLLLEGNHVRISGQDVERGTFSHRHCVIHDQKNLGDKYCALRNLSPDQAQFDACNSSLSEYGVLGFELGYALENPKSLITWEAQFGDFANTAQCMIDQFICCGEQKWLRQSGLVMLLPHGYEGQGPEHSSARLERFLQLSDDDDDVFSENIGRQKQIQAANWQVVNVTTPANYFHVLRRQVVREFRKPLVVMSPKSLLRHRLVKSDMEEFLPGTRFHRFFADSGEGLVADDKIRKLILCSGKVYFDLLLEREKLGITDVALARCEQIAPFPFDHVKAEAIKYPNADIVWCQEESKNAGAWFYTRPRIITATRDVRDIRPKYAGRAPGASTSTGSAAAHKKELEALLQQAFE